MKERADPHDSGRGHQIHPEVPSSGYFQWKNNKNNVQKYNFMFFVDVTSEILINKRFDVSAMKIALPRNVLSFPNKIRSENG